MQNLFRITLFGIITLIISIIAVHYLEVKLLPLVEKVRIFVYGKQSYSGALVGCSNLDATETWVHPATLALTVYGDAQNVLVNKYGVFGNEVLPGYAADIKGNEELICVADVLLDVSNISRVNGMDVRKYTYNIPEPTYNIDKGWVSGLAQGFVGQIFLSAYLLTNNTKYLDAARETGRLLTVPINQGGVLVKLSNRKYWYEEYAQSGKNAPIVLNGHLLALDFLHWMNLVEPNREWKLLFDLGVNAVVSNAKYFLGSYWSYYDLNYNLATGKYHRFHIRQLKRYELFDSTGILSDTRRKMEFQLYMPLGIFQRLLTQPSKLLLFQIFLIFTILFPFIYYSSAFMLKTNIGNNHEK